MNDRSSSSTLDTNKAESSYLQNSDDVTPMLQLVNPDVGDEDMTGQNLLRQFDCHLLMWSRILSAILQFTF